MNPDHNQTEPAVASMNTTTETTVPQATNHTPATASNVTVDHGRLMGILCYIGPLVLIPLLTAKNNPDVSFHIKQGLVLFGIELVIMFGGNFLLMLTMGMLYPVIMLLNLATLALSVIGIYHVVKKQEKPLPLIGQYANRVSL